MRVGAIVLTLLLAVCAPGLCVGIDERLLTKDTGPTLTFGITPGYTLPGTPVTLSGGLYNFLITLPGKEIVIERSAEYGPYEQIAAIATGDDGTFLYLDTPPGRAEHKVYYRASYVEGGKRIIETEPIYLYLGTPETIKLQRNVDESDSNENNQVREIPGYLFVIDSSLHEEERYLVVTMLVHVAIQGTTSGLLLASPCGDEFEVIAVGIPGSEGKIEFPALEGCSEYYMICPVIGTEIVSCTEPFTYIDEADKDERTKSGDLGQHNSRILRDWLSTSQFKDLLPEAEFVIEDEITKQAEVPDEIGETKTAPLQIGTELLTFELYLTQAVQRGVSTPVEVRVTSIDGAPVSGIETILFLSSDLVYWYRAADNITNKDGIAQFTVNADRLATLKTRVAFFGNERYAYGQSNTIIIST